MVKYMKLHALLFSPSLTPQPLPPLPSLISVRFSFLNNHNLERAVKAFLVSCVARNSPSGEATFRLLSDNVHSILASIRRCISVAMETRRSSAATASATQPEVRTRTGSVSTVASFQRLLDRSAPGDPSAGREGPGRDSSRSGKVKARSGSASTESTATTVSPTSSTGELPPFPADNDTDNGDGAGRAGNDGRGLAMSLSRRHRVSTTSMPATVFSNSPTASDTLGGDLQLQQARLAQHWYTQQALLWPQDAGGQSSRLQQQGSPPPAVAGDPDQLLSWIEQQRLFQQRLHNDPSSLTRVGLHRNCSVPEAMSKAADVRDYERIVGDEGKAVGWSV